MIRGILPPLTTPFIDDDIAYTKFQENIQKLDAAGLNGFLVLGSNSETAFLMREEKLDLIKAAREVIPKSKPLIAGTGVDSIRECIYLTNEAAKRGADAALIITPHFFQPAMNHEVLCRFYTTVADAADIPILIYNVPKYTGVDVDPGTIAALSTHPNIIGFKNTSENTARLSEMIAATPECFVALAGTASILYGGLAVGASGGVLALANIAPAVCLDIQRLVAAGDLKSALALQQKMLPVNKAVTATYGVAGLKAALDMLGYFGGNPRSPLGPLDQAGKAKLKSILTHADLL